MAKSEITQKQVNEIADALKVSGVKPSARAVLERLGVGSLTTILKFLQVWHSKQTPVKEPVVVLPVALQKFLFEYVAKEVAYGKEGLIDDIEQMKKNESDLIIESERQLLEINTLSVDIEKYKVDLGVLNAHLVDSKEALVKVSAELSSERTAHESTRIDVAVLKVKLEASLGALIDAKVELDVAKLAAKVAAEEAAELRGKLAQLESEVKVISEVK